MEQIEQQCKLSSVIIPSKGEKMNTWIFIHDLMSNGASLQDLAKAEEMSQNSEIHLIDLRNHGKSAKMASMFYYDLINDIRLYLDDHSLKDVCILGISYGATIAIQFCINPATNHGVKALVLSDTGPFPYYQFDKYPRIG